jgi:hypothetical protein
LKPVSATGPLAAANVAIGSKKMQRSWMIDRRCFYYVFIVVVIRYETTAAAGWTLMFIVRAFINHTITVAIWTSFNFHLCLMWMLTIHDRPVARPAFIGKRFNSVDILASG